LPISPAREAAYKILHRVDSGRAFAVDLLHGSQVASLNEADRRLTTEIVMGVLRWRGELKPMGYFDAEVRTILRVGIYQIRFLERVPKSAAVNESVELVKAAGKRSAAGLVNAVLRKFEAPARRREGREVDAEFVESALRCLPDWLRERWAGNFGGEALRSLALASVSVPPTTLRVAGQGANRAELQRELRGEGIETRPGRYSTQALVVESGSVQASATLRDGRAIIQDEASQLIASLVAPKVGQHVLDICAAPGIKTSQLTEALGSGLLVACDLSARRLRTMAELARRRIPAGVELNLVRLDATRELPFGRGFHRILLDAPCSGTGTLARNPEIKWRLQAKDLDRLAAIQTKMLRNALGILEPRGRLVYATCSLEPEENELVVERVLGEVPGFRLRPPRELLGEFSEFSPLFDSLGYFRTRPDLHFMDGFFAAVICRNE
jgi:16S rRNA (cytosine967-C5)-methyltransferase